MQVEWYRSFTEAAKWKSLSKAADKLSMTQPAISKHIRQLETAYGVELFRRTATGVELTEAGRRFLERIVPVVQSIDSIEAEMRQYTAQPGYTIGSLPSIATQVLPGRLRDYHAAGYPITVKVKQTSGELLKELQDGAVDAVLMDSAYAGGPLWSRELFTESYIVILPKGHPLQGRSALSSLELKQEHFVFTTHCDTHARFIKIAERYGYRPDVKLDVDSNDFLLGVVKVGTGITVMPELFGAQAEGLGLHTVPVAESELGRTIVLAARTAETGSKLYRLLNVGTGGNSRERAASP